MRNNMHRLRHMTAPPRRAEGEVVPLRRRAGLVLALAALNSVLYLLSNAYPLRTPIALPVTSLDAYIGWHAWTIWPYWLLLALGPVLALGLRERRILMATLRAYALAMSLNVAAWLAWPTFIGRRALPDTLDPLTDAAWRLLHALDGPNNCFPSGHVTIPLVIAAGYCAQHPRAWRWVWPLLLVLLPSVVSTGQHYAWDVAGGAATAALGLLLARRNLSRQPH